MGALETLSRPLRNRSAPEAVVERVHATLESHGVSIPVRLWNGRELGPDDAGYRVVLNEPWSLRRMLLPPNDLSAGEAYIFGAVDVEGSMVSALHDASAAAKKVQLGWLTRASLARDLLSLPQPPPDEGTRRRARLRGRLHSKSRDSEAVRFHYDVGNEFYKLFLGEHLVYSCAYFSDGDPEDPADDPTALDRAQIRKLDMICRKLRLSEGERFLDIGCGWGSLVLHAARHYGVSAVGITLSTQQAELARERVQAAGLDDRVEIRVQDYRDVEGTFDAIASIGMFEHVGEPRFSTYFERAYELLRPGGRFLNHAITTGRRMQIRDVAADSGSFLNAYVFPDGTLAPAHVAVTHLERAGFELIDVHQLRRHYARTLRHWLHNLEGNLTAARQTVGEVTYRIWRAYMAGSVVGFETGDLGVIQVLGTRGQADLPLERGWMEPGPAGAANGV